MATTLDALVHEWISLDQVSRYTTTYNKKFTYTIYRIKKLAMKSFNFKNQIILKNFLNVFLLVLNLEQQVKNIKTKDKFLQKLTSKI